MPRLLFLTLIFLFTVSCARAQDPGYTVIDKSKGLPSNSVYDLHQDNRGFIWMATDEGLCRYDGFSFLRFSNPGQSSLPGSEIQEDRFGRIWYQNFDGFVFYVENDSLKSLAQKKPLGYLPYAVAHDVLYVCSEGEVDIYDLKSLKLLRTVPVQTSVIIFSQGVGNDYYVETFNNLFRITPSGEKTSFFKSPPRTEIFGRLINNGSREVWLYNRISGQCDYATENQSGAVFNIPGMFIQTAAWSRGNVWMCSTSGCFAYDSLRRPYDNGRIYFPSKSISSVIQDRENNFWFSTTNEGVLLVSDIRSKIFFPQLSIRRLLVTGEGLMAGTQHNEIFYINPETQQTDLFYKGIGNHGMLMLENGDEYVKYFYSSDSLHLYSEKKTLRHGGGMKDIERIAPGIYAYAMSGQCGIFVDENAPPSPWKNISWAITHLTGSIKHTKVFISSLRGKSTCYDSVANTIYYATGLGFYRVTLQKAEEIKNKNRSMFFTSIICHRETVYGLTNHDSIFTFSKNGTFTHFPVRDMNSVSGIKRIGNWLFVYNSTDIACFDLDKPGSAPVRFQTYASDIYDLVLHNNQLLVACNSGLLSLPFLPGNIQKLQPVFHLNTILVNGKRFGARDASLHSLSSDMNNMLVDYSVLSFKSGGYYPLYYSINGGTPVRCSPTSRTLNFSSLASGDYEIIFSFGDEQGNLTLVDRLVFSIRKPWWYTGWAIAAYIIIFIGAIFLVYRWQLLRQEKKNREARERIELENQLNKSVLTSIKSQMNPHFFYNALNTIQSFIYANDKQNAGTYLSKFSKLTRMILEMSEKEQISLQEEVTALRLYLELEQARFDNEFHFTIEVSPDSNPEHTRLPSMIIQPYIENAVKHGLLHKKGEKQLSVKFRKEGNMLEVVIDDNGIGRTRSAELNEIRKDKPQSFSTNANQKRLNLLNLDRKVPLTVTYIDKTGSNGLASGTTVILRIPV